MLRWPWAVLSAAVGGLILWCAFAPVSAPLLAVPGMAAILAACWRAGVWRGLLSGFLSGLFFFLPLLSWMHIIGVDAWIALSIFCALWWGLMGMGLALVTRLPGAVLWAACVVVLQEALRGRIPWGGFPWGNLAFSAPGGPMLGWSTWLGSAGLSFVIALAGAAVVQIADLLVHRPRRPRAWWTAMALGGFTLILVFAGAAIPSAPAGERSSVVAIIQGGTPQLGMGAMDVRRAVLDNHVEQTRLLAREVAAGRQPQPDVVVWPENASDIDPLADPSAALAISAAARAIGAPILVGAVLEPPQDPQGLWNAGIVWNPKTGPGAVYVKTHPVPFGEYIPFREQVSHLIGRFDRIPRDFRSGAAPGILPIGGVTVGDVICFEVAYDDVIRAVVDGGAQLITVQTNNATYGGTAQPDQQFAIERLRARETGRTVVVASTTGISGIIRADGTADHVMPQGDVGSRVTQVTVSDSRTAGSVLGPWSELVACVFAVVAVIIGAGMSRAARRRRGGQPASSGESAAPYGIA